MSTVTKGLSLMRANARASLRELKCDDECLVGRQYHNSTLSGLANKEQECDDECLVGRQYHNSTLSGLANKEQEIERKIRVEESRENPDQVYLKHLYSIRDCLRGTLSRYR